MDENDSIIVTDFFGQRSEISWVFGTFQLVQLVNSMGF